MKYKVNKNTHELCGSFLRLTKCQYKIVYKRLKLGHVTPYLFEKLKMMSGYFKRSY